MEVPSELFYSEDHEWVRLDGRLARVGLTDFAQDALGEIVFIDLPDLDEIVASGDVLGEVESTKSVSEIYAPLPGRVVEVNAALVDAPRALNDDPYGEGWICVLDVGAPASTDALLSARRYEELTAATL